MEDSKKYALIIGNSQYNDKRFKKLQTPKFDAERLGKLLLDINICGFDVIDILIDKPEQTLRRSIARFFKGKHKNDMLLLYFSGHGVRDEFGDLYFATIDTELDVLSASAIPAAFVRREMNTSYSRRQLLILDCCYSGAFSGAKSALGGSVGTKAEFDVTGYGRVVLTATDATQLAWEGEELVGQVYNSAFT